MGLSIRNLKTHFFHFSVNAAASQKVIRTKLKRTRTQLESLHHLGKLEKRKPKSPLSYLTTYDFQKKSLFKSILIKCYFKECITITFIVDSMCPCPIIEQ